MFSTETETDFGVEIVKTIFNILTKNKYDTLTHTQCTSEDSNTFLLLNSKEELHVSQQPIAIK